jgi:hypothetical protein
MSRPSSIDRLPPDVRQALDRLLADPRVTQLETVARINDILARDGHPDRLSKSALNRYAVKMDEVGSKLREAHQVAELWIGRFGGLPDGQLGQLIIQVVRTLAFDVGLKLHQGELDPEAMPAAVKMLRDLSVMLERTERAAVLNAERVADIKRQAAAELAEQVAAEGPTVTPERLRQIVREAYGV